MITCIITGLRARPMSSCVSAQPACAMRPMMITQKRPAAGRHGHVWPTIASRTARKKSCEKRPMWKSSSCFAAVPSLSIGNFSMKSCTIFFGITKCGTITRAPRQPMTVSGAVQYTPKCEPVWVIMVSASHAPTMPVGF